MRFTSILPLAFALLCAACDETQAPLTPTDGAAADTGSATDAGVDGLAAECMPKVHPGTVTFIDEDAGTTTVDNADGVPDSIKWHDTSGGRVPVVKVVKHKLANGSIELLLYGPCGQLLEVVHGMT